MIAAVPFISESNPSAAATPLRVSLSLILLCFAAACGSSSSTITAPSTITRCSVSANGANGSLPAGGGAGTISVSAARECAWTASTEVAWLSIRSGRSGQGDGAVEFAASANPEPSARRGAVILNEQRVEVVQAAGECTISLAESGATFPQAGGAGQVEIRASSTQCSWTAESEADWIVLRGGRDGRGPATVAFDVAATTGAPRSGAIVIAGRRFTVTQSEGCVYRLGSDSYAAPAAGGSGVITLTTGPSCPWTAASSASWVTLGQTQGTGSAAVPFTVTPGSSRTGTVVVGGQTFTISQAQPQTSCTYTLEPRSHSIGAAGGTVAISVATGSGCQWSAATPVAWVGLNGTGTFVGSGSVSFTVGPASGAARSATVTVADQPVTIAQSAQNCTASLSPERVEMAAAGGPGSTAVTVGAGCAWTAVSASSWIQVVSGASGTGNGTVGFQVAPAASSSRTGTLTIAGRTLTVTQAATACTHTIAPDARNVGATGGTFDVSVTGPASCAWAAASQASWITVRESGNGTAQVTVASNTGAARTGTVTIAGRTLTVTQAAAPATCDFTVRPRRVKIGFLGGPVRLEVQTSRECAWTAASDVPWIRVLSGGSGSGDGEVSILVVLNTGGKREGRVTIGTETVSVEQKRAGNNDDDDDDDDDDD